MARTIARRKAATSPADNFQPDEDTYTDDEGEIGEPLGVDDMAIGDEGWASNEEYRRKTRQGPNRIKVGEGETILVKSLDKAPFTTYISRFFKALNRGFIALEKDDPLDGFGEDGRAMSAFNVVPLASDKDDSPYNAMNTLEVFILQASPSLTDALKKVAQSKRGPLDRQGLYLEITYTVKANGFGEYAVQPIQESDIEEIWDVEPITADEIKELLDSRLTKEDWPHRQSREELEQAAAKLREQVGGRGADPARRRRG